MEAWLKDANACRAYSSSRMSETDPHSKKFQALFNKSYETKRALIHITFWWNQNGTLSSCIHAFPCPFGKFIKRGKALGPINAVFAGRMTPQDDVDVDLKNWKQSEKRLSRQTDGP